MTEIGESVAGYVYLPAHAIVSIFQPGEGVTCLITHVASDVWKVVGGVTYYGIRVFTENPRSAVSVYKAEEDERFIYDRFLVVKDYGILRVENLTAIAGGVCYSGVRIG